LELAIIVALIREIEGLIRANAVRQFSRRDASIVQFAECPQTFFIGVAPLHNFILVHVQDRQLGHAKCKTKRGVPGSERDRLLEALDRVLSSPELSERNAPVSHGVRIIWLESERFIVTRQRLFKPVQIAKNTSAIIKSLRIIRFKCNRLIEARQGL